MRLLDVCTISGKKVNKYDGTRKYIATGDVDYNQIVNYTDYSFDTKPSRANQNVEIGEVLFAKMKDTIKVILINESNYDNIYSTGFYVLKPNKNILSKYLYYYLMSNFFNDQKNKLCVGATMKGLNNEGLKQIEIGELPSIVEQNMIVNKIETIEKILINRKKANLIVSNLITTKYYELFSNDYENKDLFKPLKTVTTFIDYRGKTPSKIDSGVPLITAKNVKKDFFSIEPREFISEDEYNARMTRGKPKTGDVLFTTEAPLGNVCIIPDLGGVFSVGQRLITMKCNNVNNYYLMYTLLYDEIQNEILKKSTGSTVKGIKSKYLAEIEIPVPSIEKQKKFGEYVEILNKISDLISRDIDTLNNMIILKFKEVYGEM